MASLKKHLEQGLLFENPTFIQVLGMCPTLAVTTSAINGIGMGLSVVVVLIGSNVLISLLRNIIPSKARIPAYIVVIASLVTVIDMLLQALFYDTLYQQLGLYIPLIVVNCIILGRAEAYASKNTVADSALDGLSMGLGFTMALTILGSVREILGAGTLFGISILPASYQPITILLMAPGGFFVLGLLMAGFNSFKNKVEKKRAAKETEAEKAVEEVA